MHTPSSCYSVVAVWHAPCMEVLPACPTQTHTCVKKKTEAKLAGATPSPHSL